MREALNRVGQEFALAVVGLTAILGLSIAAVTLVAVWSGLAILLGSAEVTAAVAYRNERAGVIRWILLGMGLVSLLLGIMFSIGASA